MKIVLIGGQSIPGIGGIESYVFNMAKSLRALGHEPVIICSDRETYINTVDEIEIVHKKCPKSNMIALPLLFIISLGYIFQNRKSINIVNFQSIFFAFLPGWIVKTLGCKVCYTIHSLAEDNPKHSGMIKLIMKATAFVSIWLCGKKILTVSNSKAKEIKTRYGKDCSVIPCGVQLPCQNTESDITKRFNIKHGYYYLTIGRIDPIKNLDILTQAFIKHNNPDYQLIIAGDYNNPHGKYLRDIASPNKNIIFVGSVMGADKDYLLKNCFANCLVSSSEGMPISLLEAMVYGKHCIVSDIPSIHEVMQDDWGCWCNVRDIDSLAEQMAYAEKNHETIDQHSQTIADAIAEHYTWNIVAKKYINYIQTI